MMSDEAEEIQIRLLQVQTPSSFFTFRRLLGYKIAAIWEGGLKKEEKQNWARWL